MGELKLPCSSGDELGSDGGGAMGCFPVPWFDDLSSSGGGTRLPSGGVPVSLGDAGDSGEVRRTSSTEDAVAFEFKRSRPRPKFCRMLSRLGLRPSNGTGGGASSANEPTVYRDALDNLDAREAIEDRE